VVRQSPVFLDVMTTEESAKVVALLEELRAGQQQQLAQQLEALELQRKQFTAIQEQAARTERIQQKAEQLQDRGATLVRGTRTVIVAIVMVIVVLLVYVSWLLVRSRV
jgi:murein L,D-transpeptidase YcbB/YkuD